jgi:hypothetical protein
MLNISPSKNYTDNSTFIISYDFSNEVQIPSKIAFRSSNATIATVENPKIKGSITVEAINLPVDSDLVQAVTYDSSDVTIE